jgi:hypothetical protein
LGFDPPPSRYENGQKNNKAKTKKYFILPPTFQYHLIIAMIALYFQINFGLTNSKISSSGSSWSFEKQIRALCIRK